VPTPVWQALPAPLTVPLAEPPMPPLNCHVAGVDVPCALEGLAQIDAWRGGLQQCNADRSTAAQIGAAEPKAVQP
jgi:hypothetical protein